MGLHAFPLVMAIPFLQACNIRKTLIFYPAHNFSHEDPVRVIEKRQKLCVNFPPCLWFPRLYTVTQGSTQPLAIHWHFTQILLIYSCWGPVFSFFLSLSNMSQYLCLLSPMRPPPKFLCLDFRVVCGPMTNSVIGTKEVMILYIIQSFLFVRMGTKPLRFLAFYCVFVVSSIVPC